jgi:hypothetical protein
LSFASRFGVCGKTPAPMIPAMKFLRSIFYPLVIWLDQYYTNSLKSNLQIATPSDKRNRIEPRQKECNSPPSSGKTLRSTDKGEIDHLKSNLRQSTSFPFLFEIVRESL